MSVPEHLVKLAGNWRGTKRLHLPWETEHPVRESESAATVALPARGKFWKLEYDWMFEGERQDGLLLVGRAKEDADFGASWIDSWHNGHNEMQLGGPADGEKLDFRGVYSVPDQPPWGWRIVIAPDGEDAWALSMFNVTPDGEEMLAVELDYRRV